MKKSFLILFFFFLFWLPLPTKAQDNFGLDKVSEELILGETEIISTAAKIVNISFGFLTTLSICIVLYAGFLWLRAGDNEEIIIKAKKTLVRGFIGTVIIISSWGLVSMMIEETVEATECQPKCKNRACGDDGCGGSCGECESLCELCNSNGKCYTPTFKCGDKVCIKNIGAYICNPGAPYYDTCIYDTIQIGSKCWFKENLNIGLMKTTGHQDNDEQFEKWCQHGIANNCYLYGGFYQWHEAVQAPISCSTPNPHDCYLKKLSSLLFFYNASRNLSSRMACSAR